MRYGTSVDRLPSVNNAAVVAKDFRRLLGLASFPFSETTEGTHVSKLSQRLDQRPKTGFCGELRSMSLTK